MCKVQGDTDRLTTLLLLSPCSVARSCSSIQRQRLKVTTAGGQLTLSPSVIAMHTLKIDSEPCSINKLDKKLFTLSGI